jgi:Uma2 family endonuclease
MSTAASPGTRIVESSRIPVGAGPRSLPIVGQIPLALPHRLTVEQVEAMIRAGILTENDRCELIRGELIDKMVIGDPHMAAVKRLNHWFTSRAAKRYLVGVQDSVKLIDSLPEPDLMLLRYRADFYVSQTPAPADVLLLIEVADSSLDYDRTVKLPLYAENGIAEYWLVNLVDECIEVHRQPGPNGTYAEPRVVGRGERLAPLALADLELSAEEIFG